jgi:hypothetical protein
MPTRHLLCVLSTTRIPRARADVRTSMICRIMYTTKTKMKNPRLQCVMVDGGSLTKK